MDGLTLRRCMREDGITDDAGRVDWLIGYAKGATKRAARMHGALQVILDESEPGSWVAEQCINGLRIAPEPTERERRYREERVEIDRHEDRRMAERRTS